MKLLGLVLALLMAAHAHATVTLYGCPLSVPVAAYAAVVFLVPFAAILVLGRRAMRHNRHPRFCWLAVTA